MLVIVNASPAPPPRSLQHYGLRPEVPQLEPIPAPVFPLLEPRPLRCGRCVQGPEQRRLLWAYGLGDTGTGHGRDPAGLSISLCLYRSRRSEAACDGRAGADGDQGLGRQSNDPFVGCSSDHTKRPWGPAPALIGWSAVPMGLARPPTWWVPPGSLWQKFALLRVIALLLPKGLFHNCVNLPYSAPRQRSLQTVDTSLPAHRLNTAVHRLDPCRTQAASVLAPCWSARTNRATSAWGSPPALLNHSGEPWLALGVCRRSRAIAKRPHRRIPEPMRSCDRIGAKWSRFLRVLGLYCCSWCGLQA